MTTIGVKFETVSGLSRDALLPLVRQGCVTVQFDNPDESQSPFAGMPAEVKHTLRKRYIRQREGQLSELVGPVNTPSGRKPELRHVDVDTGAQVGIGMFWGTEAECRNQVQQWATHENGQWKLEAA